MQRRWIGDVRRLESAGAHPQRTEVWPELRRVIGRSATDFAKASPAWRLESSWQRAPHWTHPQKGAKSCLTTAGYPSSTSRLVRLIAASSVDSALGGAGTWLGAQRWLDRATARA